MKVCGFSFIRNAIKYQYPVAEALSSILPLCDEVFVAVGNSDDGTRALIEGLSPKIHIIDTVWNDRLREEGKVLAVETDKALRAVTLNYHWCIYIQGDEVMHEAGYDEVKKAMEKWKDDKRVDGLLFKYRHFYGSYDYIGASSRWYKREIRVIKNDPAIFSYRDAQGFRKNNNEKLSVKALNAYIHHYGWVREPEAMYAKTYDFSKHWSGDKWQPQKTFSKFDYSQHVDGLQKFTGTHPSVMHPLIEKMNWQFEFDPSFSNLPFKEKLKNYLEKITGKRPFDHNNFKIV
ncbi:MAG: glycosyltransferase family 2 protein [Flavisolibacter sp.]|jgi:hypothetical protein|nr:glycosyltransferase family 2 protein [Flavisolibacter sp.]